MFNANNVLDLLVEALREGGEVRLREVAKTYASENLGAFDEAALTEALDELLAALKDFDKVTALAVVEGVQERIRPVEEDSADEEDDEDADEAGDTSLVLEARVTALEKGLAELRQVAVSRGLI